MKLVANKFEIDALQANHQQQFAYKFEMLRFNSNLQKKDMIHATMLEYKMNFELQENELPKRFYVLFN